MVRSLALQQTLYEIGKAVLEHYPAIAEVRLSAPNKHHFVYDLSKFGLQNNNEVFHADDRPYGLIQATVTRDDAPAPGPCSRDGWPDLQLLKISNTDCRRSAIGRKVRNRLSSQPKLENVIDVQGEELPAARALRTQGLYLDVSHSTKYPYSD